MEKALIFIQNYRKLYLDSVFNIFWYGSSFNDLVKNFSLYLYDIRSSLHSSLHSLLLNYGNESLSY
jgi:hypothetical protein